MDLVVLLHHTFVSLPHIFLTDEENILNHINIVTFLIISYEY